MGTTGRPARIPLRALEIGNPAMPDRLAAFVAATDGVAYAGAGPLRMALVADPALTRHVLTLPHGTRQGRGLHVVGLVLGEGLLTSQEPLHHRQRRLVQPVFHPRLLRAYAADTVALGRARAAAWRGGGTVDLAAEMSSLTLSVVARTLFGAELGTPATGDGHARVAAAAQGLVEVFPSLMRLTGPLLLRLPTRTRRRFRGDVAALDAVVDDVLRARRAGLASAGAEERADVATLLLTSRDPQTGEPMPARLVRDEVLTLLMAGHETTAVALTWAWFELSRTPAARAALHAELDRTASREALARGDWDALPVTRAVVAETLRLHPPAYALGRIATQDLDLGGHRVRAGTAILMTPYGLHRDPRSWRDPLTFDPQRWLTAQGTFDEAAPGQPRGAYLPFGAGSRVCIGAAFAVMEAVLLLGVLATDWDPRLPDGFDPGLQPAVTLRTRHPVTATLRPRAA